MAIAAAMFIGLLVCGHLFFTLAGSGLRGEVLAAAQDGRAAETVDAVFDRLATFLALAMVLVAAGFVAALIYVEKTVIRPINTMARAAQKMAQGHLNNLVPATGSDEIAAVGELINDLAVNLQEVLLCVWNQTGKSEALLADIIGQLDDQRNNTTPDRIMEDVKMLRQGIADMQSMVQAFEYYDIRLDEGKVLAEEPPGHE